VNVACTSNHAPGFPAPFMPLLPLCLGWHNLPLHRTSIRLLTGRGPRLSAPSGHRLLLSPSQRVKARQPADFWFLPHFYPLLNDQWLTWSASMHSGMPRTMYSKSNPFCWFRDTAGATLSWATQLEDTHGLL
jgi:hypothetical protein